MQIFTKMIWFIRNVNRFLSDNKNILNISSHIWIQKIKDKVYIVYFIVPSNLFTSQKYIAFRLFIHLSHFSRYFNNYMSLGLETWWAWGAKE